MLRRLVDTSPGNHGRDRACGTRRVALCGAIAALLLCLPGSLLAAQLTEVRVGRHPDYTRVVLETDAPAEHTISRAEPGVVRIDLSASARPGRTPAKGDLLRAVVVEPAGAGSVARLELGKGDVEVSELVLSNPPRIVIDLRKAAPGSGAKAAAEKPKMAASPTAAVKPTAAPAPQVAEAPSAARKPAGLAEPRPSEAAPPAEEPPPAVAKLPPPAPGTPEAGARAGMAPGDEEGLREEPTSEPLGEAGAAPGEPVQDRLAMEPPPPPAPSLAPRPPVPTTAPRGGSGGALGFLPAPLDEPIVLAGIGSVLALIAVLVLVRRRARRSEEETASPFASAAPTEAAEAPSGEGASESLFDKLGEVGGDASIFGSEEEDEEKPEEAPAAAQAVAPAAAPIETEAPQLAAPGGDVMRMVEELERRLGHLETRLEEVVDAKERLERQVAAQTEELRVQRAAIARTQRVLRTVTRTEEEASEPVPKN